MLFKKGGILSLKYKMSASLLAKDIHPSKRSPVWLKLCSGFGYNPNLIITFQNLPGSSNTAHLPLFKYSATTAVGAGPSVRSAQGEEWWLTVWKRFSSPRLISSTWIDTDNYPRLSYGEEPLGLVWLMLWGFQMWGGGDGEYLGVAGSILIARWAGRGRGWRGGREVHSW